MINAIYEVNRSTKGYLAIKFPNWSIYDLLTYVQGQGLQVYESDGLAQARTIKFAQKVFRTLDNKDITIEAFTGTSDIHKTDTLILAFPIQPTNIKLFKYLLFMHDTSEYKICNSRSGALTELEFKGVHHDPIDKYIYSLRYCGTDDPLSAIKETCDIWDFGYREHYAKYGVLLTIDIRIPDHHRIAVLCKQDNDTVEFYPELNDTYHTLQRILRYTELDVDYSSIRSMLWSSPNN